MRATEAVATEVSSLPAGDVNEALAALSQEGADRHDPLGFHFIETLARRVAASDGVLHQALMTKLAQAVARSRKRLAEASGAEASGEEAPVADTRANPLAELVSYIAQQGQDSGQDVPELAMGTHDELKSLQHFRESWTQLSVDQQVNQSLAKGPANAGPLNSHLLVLRSIELMRDVAPGYLKHFMAYADALLWLEQAQGSLTGEKRGTGGEKGTKRKPPPGGSR
ncbi:MAG TPA: DUF2894 domain-containing protein [Rhodocyclaceae bacterium]|jgi:hypothetical protein